MKAIVWIIMCGVLVFGVVQAQPRIEWDRTYIGNDPTACHSFIRTHNGGFALAGVSSRSETDTDFRIVLTDSVGNMIWYKQYDRSGVWIKDVCYSLVEVEDSGFLLAGTTTPFESLNSDFWLVRTDEMVILSGN